MPADNSRCHAANHLKILIRKPMALKPVYTKVFEELSVILVIGSSVWLIDQK